MARRTKSKRKQSPRAVLKLSDLEQSKSAVLNSLTSPSSQRSYDHAIREFIDGYCSEPRLAFNKTVVTRYRISLEQRHYAASTINLRLAAVQRLAYKASDYGLLSPDLAAGVRRVRGARRLGARIGNWLMAEEGRRLIGVFGIPGFLMAIVRYDRYSRLLKVSRISLWKSSRHTAGCRLDYLNPVISDKDI